MHLALDRAAVGADDDVAVAAQFGEVAVFEIDDLAGDLQQRGGVGGCVHAVLADAQQQRRAAARDDDAEGVGLGDHADGVGADEIDGGLAHRLEQVGVALQLVVDQVGDSLGVGLGLEDVALALQVGLDRLEVLDDAVMHHGEAAGDVRVGVALGGHAVGGPARVGDADVGGELARIGQRSELGHAAAGAQAGELAGEHGEAGGVIATVFELAQAFEQDRDDVVGCDCGDDATHGGASLSVFGFGAEGGSGGTRWRQRLSAAA